MKSILERFLLSCFDCVIHISRTPGCEIPNTIRYPSTLAFHKHRKLLYSDILCFFPKDEMVWRWKDRKDEWEIKWKELKTGKWCVSVGWNSANDRTLYNPKIIHYRNHSADTIGFPVLQIIVLADWSKDCLYFIYFEFSY